MDIGGTHKEERRWYQETGECYALGVRKEAEVNSVRDAEETRKARIHKGI